MPAVDQCQRRTWHGGEQRPYGGDADPARDEQHGAPPSPPGNQAAARSLRDYPRPDRHVGKLAAVPACDRRSDPEPATVRLRGQRVRVRNVPATTRQEPPTEVLTRRG